MKKSLVLAFTFVFACNVSATQMASSESVEELMKLTEVSKMIDAMHGQIGNMFNGMSQQMGISEQEKPAFNEYMQKAVALLKADMSWDKLKMPMSAIYAKHFSEEEVVGLINFYKSDLGRSMTKKMPLIMQDSMVITQELMKDFMPKIQALAAELQKDIQKSREEVAQ